MQYRDSRMTGDSTGEGRGTKDEWGRGGTAEEGRERLNANSHPYKAKIDDQKLPVRNLKSWTSKLLQKRN